MERSSKDGGGDGDAAAPDGARQEEAFDIRCQGAAESWSLRVQRATRVHELKALVAAASGTPAAQQRLIYQGACLLRLQSRALRTKPDTRTHTHTYAQGRVLLDGDTLGGVGVSPGHAIHVAVRPPGAPPPAPDVAAASNSAPPSSSSSAAVPPEAAAALAGLRDEDLLVLRRALEHELRLLAQHGGGGGGAGAGASGAAAGAPRRGVFSGSREGDTGDFCLGLAFGLLLGLVAFMCLLEPSAPRRLKAGLFLGALACVRARSNPMQRTSAACMLTRASCVCGVLQACA
jgi:hypothetical protein